MRDLFRLDAPVGASEGFRADPAQSGFIFDNNALTLSVDQALWGGYQRAANDVAHTITDDPALLDRIAPPDTGDADARALAFIEDFGQRAHRRPLTETEIAEYMDVYRAAATLYDGLDPFVAGVRLLISAFLQSPHFLYRIELSDEVDDGVVPLDDWEIASRLSYALWNSMPDDELFAAARAGELTDPDNVRMHAERLLDDPRAEDVALRFHQQLLRVEKFQGNSPSPAFFPEAPADLPTLALTENELFVRDLFTGGGSFGDMLTSTRTFVNDDLAALYGLEGSYGSDFVAAELDPAQRRGVFTQIGFLAANSSSVNPDPIHRGVFLAERITCAHIGVPPEEIPPLPPPMGRTNRQTVEDHTQVPGCVSCHGTIINPFGFPFESYDAMGQWRTEDSGYPVDTTASPYVDGEQIPVDGAVDLLDTLAATETVHRCYAQHWLEFAFGRPKTSDDGVIVEHLAQESLAGASIKELVAALVTSRVFLNRSMEELP